MAPASGFTVETVKVAGWVAPSIAAIVTIARLFERVRRAKFGYDDAFAALSVSILMVYVAGLFVHLADPTHLPRTTRVGMYYILAQSFYGVIWSARLSILFSIVRITPTGGNTIKILYGLVGSFVLLWAILFAQVFWVCEYQLHWKDLPNPQCALGRSVGIAQLISDIFADTCLIVAPLRLLWNLSIARVQRNRLLWVFSSSIVTSVASLIHAAYLLRVGGLYEVLVAIIEISISLLVCNLAVMVGLVARVVESRRGTESYGMSRSKTAVSGFAVPSGEFISTSTRTVDDGLNVKAVNIHTGPFGDSTYPKEDKAFKYPEHPDDSHYAI